MASPKIIFKMVAKWFTFKKCWYDQSGIFVIISIVFSTSKKVISF